MLSVVAAGRGRMVIGQTATLRRSWSEPNNGLAVSVLVVVAAIGGVLGVVGAIAKNTAAELDDD
jgi:hypothetical protein